MAYFRVHLKVTRGPDGKPLPVATQLPGGEVRAINGLSGASDSEFLRSLGISPEPAPEEGRR